MKNLKLIIVAVVGIFFGAFIMKQCNTPKPIKEVITQIKTDTVYVERIITKTSKPVQIKPSIVYVPKEIYKENIDKIRYNKDTIELVRDYYTQKIFTDTLIIDSLSKITINDTLHMNKLIGRQYTASITHPVIYKEVTKTVIPKPRNQLYVGGSLTSQIEGMYIGPNLAWKTKKNAIYGVGYYLNIVTGTRAIQGTFLIKVGKK